MPNTMLIAQPLRVFGFLDILWAIFDLVASAFEHVPVGTYALVALVLLLIASCMSWSVPDLKTFCASIGKLSNAENITTYIKPEIYS